MSDNQNKLVSYAGRKVITEGPVSILEGYPINSVWGYQTAGYFQTADEVTKWAFQNSKTGAGDVKYVDLNGDGKITAGSGTPEDHGDLVNLGSDQPRYLFGLTGSVDWKGFDVSFFFQGVGKRSFTPRSGTIVPLGEAFNMPQRLHLDYWTVDNPDAAFPRPYLQGAHNFLASDKWTFNGRYIRLKNIQVGYSLPESILKKVRVSRARFFLSGQDIWTFSKMGAFNGLFNPESKNNVGNDYPFFSTVSMGLNLSF